MTNSTFFTKTVLKPARMAYSEIVELIPCWFFVYFHHFNIPLGSPPPFGTYNEHNIVQSSDSLGNYLCDKWGGPRWKIKTQVARRIVSLC